MSDEASERGRENDILGETGQTQFKLWCQRAGMVVNPPETDRMGWDFLLQFNVDRGVNLPKDIRFFDVSVFVQVKTTRSLKPKIGITLANWAHLVQRPDPCFVAVILMDQDEKPNSLHLVHIGESYIEKILRKQRESNRPDNRGTLSVYISASDKIGFDYSNKIKQRIIETISSDPSSYAREKIDFVKTVGYLPYRHRVSLEIQAPVEQIVNTALGLKGTVQITSGVMERDIRFGLPEETIRLPAGNVLIEPSGLEVSLIFKRPGKKTLSVPARLFSTQYLGIDLPPEHRRTRISYILGEFLIDSSGTIDARFMFPIDESGFDRKAQFELAALISMFSMGPGDLRIAVSRDDKEAISMTARNSDFAGIIFDQETSELSWLVCSFSEVVDFLGQRNRSVGAISLGQLKKFAGPVFELATAITRDVRARIQVDFHLAEPLEPTRNPLATRIGWFCVDGTFYLYSLVYDGRIMPRGVNDKGQYLYSVDGLPTLHDVWTVEDLDTVKLMDARLKFADEIEVTDRAVLVI